MKKILNGFVSFVIAMLIVFIIVTLFVSLLVACIWLWRHWITGGFYV